MPVKEGVHFKDEFLSFLFLMKLLEGVAISEATIGGCFSVEMGSRNRRLNSAFYSETFLQKGFIFLKEEVINKQEIFYKIRLH